jgi:methyl-accepting chemotaxis protein
VRFLGKLLALLAVSVVLGCGVAFVFLQAAARVELAAGFAMLAAIAVAVGASGLAVYHDSKRFLPALAAPRTTAPEEGKRAASWLAGAPDRIALVALVAGSGAIWIGVVVDAFRGGRGLADLEAPALVGGLLGGMVAAIAASVLATRVATGVALPAPSVDDRHPGIGIGQRVLIVNGSAAVIGLAAFGLVAREDVALDGTLGLSTWIAGTGLSLAMVVAAWISGRSIQASMGSLVREVQNVASGDLTRTVSAPGGGEVAALAGALTKMSASLKSILNNIKSVSNEVASASEDIAVSSSVMAGKIKDQATHVDSIAGSVATSTRALADIARRTDEVGLDAEKSSASIVEMMASIRTVAENARALQSKGDDSAQAVEKILTSIREVGKGAESLVQLAARTSVAVREIDAGVQQIGRALQESRELSERVSRDAREGGGAVRSLIGAVEDIRRQVDQVAQVILGLDRKSHEIQNILDVITDIADQTSLLALNAAIIAAQAGDRGKGFAVIADEIKGLAERTGGATKEIGRVIREVKKEVATAGQGMGSATGKAADGVALSQSAGRALDAIIASAGSSKDRIAEIAKASEQAAVQSKEIVSAILGVTKVARELEAAVSASAQAGTAAGERTKIMLAISAQVARAMEEQSQASATIVEAVHSTLESLQGISAATTAQKKDAEGIQTSVEQIRGNAMDNATHVADLERVVQTLIQEAVVLRHEIDRFKTVETKSRKTGFE